MKTITDLKSKPLADNEMPYNSTQSAFNEPLMTPIGKKYNQQSKESVYNPLWFGLDWFNSWKKDTEIKEEKKTEQEENEAVRNSINVNLIGYGLIIILGILFMREF